MGFGLLRYVGSKGKAARDLMSLAPIEIGEYREIFAGSACLLGQVPQEIPRWINDINPKVVNFFTRLRDDGSFVDEIMELKGRLADATAAYHAFHDAKHELAKGNDLAYFILTRYSYGQNVGFHRQGIATFSYCASNDGMSPITRERVEKDREILQGVTITCGDYANLLNAGGENVWIFADPPYDVVGGKPAHYEFSFTQDDQRTLKNRLLECPHRCLMTIGVTPLIEQLYETSEFNVTYRQCRCSSVLGQHHPLRLEMIVRNYRNQ
jgi:site-specific DNA-adenine methylase